jgi:autotransporter family porin
MNENTSLLFPSDFIAFQCATMKTYLLFTFFFLSTALSAQIIYVDQDATGQNDGSSWTNAYTDLNEALDVAQYGDSIWVAEGVYFPTDDNDRTQHFTLRSGVKLIGGFTGTETEKTQRDWETYLTILDGDIGVPGDSTDNSYSVIHILPCDSTTWLDGFVVQHGQADSNFIGDSLIA